MSTTNAHSQYLESQITTATPGRLLVITFDAAIRFARAAAESMKLRKLDEQSANIIKVQNILLQLMSSLNRKADPELADTLESLYTFMFDLLTQANIKDDAEALQKVTNMLTEMRGTWAEAELLVRSGQAEAREMAGVA